MPNTGQFKKGQHWRERKPWWDREWLDTEYTTKKRSAAEIAAEGDVTENAILFWIAKHKIPTRKMTEIRAMKHWGVSGEKNPMFGKRGILNANWQGGMTPARQQIYARSEWRQLVRQVYARDKCCRLCESLVKLEIHHIDPFSQAPLLMLDIGNVILLCHNCHKKLRRKEHLWKRKLFNLIKTERR
jgi:hypothetical protein